MEELGIFGLIDLSIAQELDVDVEVYNQVIREKCTYWERIFIVTVFLDQIVDKMDKAREIFNNRRVNGSSQK
jgi:hypothetical protein